MPTASLWMLGKICRIDPEDARSCSPAALFSLHDPRPFLWVEQREMRNMRFVHPKAQRRKARTNVFHHHFLRFVYLLLHCGDLVNAWIVGIIFLLENSRSIVAFFKTPIHQRKTGWDLPFASSTRAKIPHSYQRKAPSCR